MMKVMSDMKVKNSLLAISLAVSPCLCGASLSAVPKNVPAFVMRIDDNHSVEDWRRIADIFERHGMRCSFAVVPAMLSEKQGACLKELSDRGHVIMDHTPNHAFYTLTYADRTMFEKAKGLPFVHEADEVTMTLRFNCEADDADPENGRFRAKIENNVLTFLDKKDPFRTFNQFIRVSGRPEIFGLSQRDGRKELRDFWARPLKDRIDIASCEVLCFGLKALQPCDDLLRELAKVSRERFDHFNLPRPRIWVRPGGWEPGIDCRKLERIYGREFGYVGADSSIGAKRGSSRWTTGYDKMYFFDQSPQITPEQLVDEIQRNLASGRFHVTLSHMWCRGLPGGMQEWFAKTERFVQLLVDRKIPVMTMVESLAARFGTPKIKRSEGLVRAGYSDAGKRADVFSTVPSEHTDPVWGADGRYRGELGVIGKKGHCMLDRGYYTSGVHATRHDVDVDQRALDSTDHSPVVVDFIVREISPAISCAEDFARGMR